MPTHSKEKPYQCSFCDKEFVYDADLTNTMNMHSGEKPYQCSICDKAFLHNRNLTVHLTVHLFKEELPY